MVNLGNGFNLMGGRNRSCVGRLEFSLLDALDAADFSLKNWPHHAFWMPQSLSLQQLQIFAHSSCQSGLLCLYSFLLPVYNKVKGCTQTCERPIAGSISTFQG
jgi:hypothetical protein